VANPGWPADLQLPTTSADTCRGPTAKSIWASQARPIAWGEKIQYAGGQDYDNGAYRDELRPAWCRQLFRVTSPNFVAGTSTCRLTSQDALNERPRDNTARLQEQAVQVTHARHGTCHLHAKMLSQRNHLFGKTHATHQSHLFHDAQFMRVRPRLVAAHTSPSLTGIRGSLASEAKDLPKSSVPWPAHWAWFERIWPSDRHR
jgi:hypothetical protein